MPTENRFRRNNPHQILQALEHEDFPRHRQSPWLVVAQKTSLLLQQFFQHPILSRRIGFGDNVARYLTAIGPLTLEKFPLVCSSWGCSMPLRPPASL